MSIKNLSQFLAHIIKEIKFKSIEAKISLANRTLNIEQSLIYGDLEGNFTGTISLRKPFNASTLNLKGNVKPSIEFQKNKKIPFAAILTPEKLKKGIPIKISGSIRKPRMNL